PKFQFQNEVPGKLAHGIELAEARFAFLMRIHDEHFTARRVAAIRRRGFSIEHFVRLVTPAGEVLAVVKIDETRLGLPTAGSTAREQKDGDGGEAKQCSKKDALDVHGRELDARRAPVASALVPSRLFIGSAAAWDDL